MNTDFFEKIATERVMIIGDVMVDSYLWGNVTRLSPEAPVPVVSVTKREQRLGGAANVALNINALGAMPIICSVLGNDDSGKVFQKIMYTQNMDRRGIVVSDNRMTTVKSRVIGNNTQIVRVDEENTHPLSTVEEDLLMDRIIKTVKAMPIDAIIFQDYDKGNITPRIIEEVTDLARRKKILTTAAPKHRNFALYKGFGLIKTDMNELFETININSQDNIMTKLEEASKTLHQQQNAGITLITLPEAGLFACDFRGEEPKSLHLAKITDAMADISGSGDTVISVMTLALAAGMDFEQSFRYANAANSIVCHEKGVVPIDKEKLYQAISSEK